MIAGLESIHESQPERGTAFFGIMRASELIPYDSAIFVCTDAVSLDENLGQYAALTLLKKRIRVSVIHHYRITYNNTDTEARHVDWISFVDLLFSIRAYTALFDMVRSGHVDDRHQRCERQYERGRRNAGRGGA